MTACSERDRLIAEYKLAINDYIRAAGNLRYADSPELTEIALAASEAAQQVCDDARTALECHIHRHGCSAKVGGFREGVPIVR